MFDDKKSSHKTVWQPKRIPRRIIIVQKWVLRSGTNCDFSCFYNSSKFRCEEKKNAAKIVSTFTWSRNPIVGKDKMRLILFFWCKTLANQRKIEIYIQSMETQISPRVVDCLRQFHDLSQKRSINTARFWAKT